MAGPYSACLCSRLWSTTCSARTVLLPCGARRAKSTASAKTWIGLNKENIELGDQVRALKTDPRLIEKIAREDLQRAKPGEIIIRIPPSQQLAPESRTRP